MSLHTETCAFVQVKEGQEVEAAGGRCVPRRPSSQELPGLFLHKIACSSSVQGENLDILLANLGKACRLPM